MAYEKNYNGSVKFNSNEVDSWKWMSLDNIIDDIKAIPENYTEWFKIIMNNYYYQLKKIQMKVTVSRKAHFNAAHRLYNKKWSMEKNDQIFGK